MLPSTTVRPPRGVRLALRLGYPLAGLLLFLLLTLAVEAAAQASDSFDGVLGRADRVGEPVALVVAGALGLLLGVVWSSSVLAEALRAQVGGRAISLTWDDARVSVPRTLIQEVVVGSDVVLLGAGTVELARVRCDLDRPALLEALAEHGYPAPRAEDPHENVFTPWERSAQDLPRQERRLLAARAEALTDGAHGDAELLRRQLAARGVMVRDVHRPGRRARVQEWRRHPRGRSRDERERRPRRRPPRTGPPACRRPERPCRRPARRRPPALDRRGAARGRAAHAARRARLTSAATSPHGSEPSRFHHHIRANVR